HLTYYADRFPIVEVDSTFYGTPTTRTTRGWRDRTPDGFRFALKVPRAITHNKQLRDCQAEVDGFVAAVEPLGEKAMVALLQMGYFNRSACGSLGEFLDVLDAFLAYWPHDRLPLAVETRTPRWVGEDLLNVLRKHGTSFTLTDQKWMPTPRKILDTLDPVT